MKCKYFKLRLPTNYCNFTVMLLRLKIHLKSSFHFTSVSITKHMDHILKQILSWYIWMCYKATKLYKMSWIYIPDHPNNSQIPRNLKRTSFTNGWALSQLSGKMYKINQPYRIIKENNHFMHTENFTSDLCLPTTSSSVKLATLRTQ